MSRDIDSIVDRMTENAWDNHSSPKIQCFKCDRLFPFAKRWDSDVYDYHFCSEQCLEDFEDTLEGDEE